MESIFRCAAARHIAAGLAISLPMLGGCSTVSSLSPFGSSVPYAANVKPTIARPASPEIPVYTPPPAAPVAASPRPAPVPPPAASTPAPKPVAEAQPAAPTKPAPPAQPSAPETSPTPTSAPEILPPPLPPPDTHSSIEQPAAPAAAQAKPASSDAAKPVHSADQEPSIPKERRAFTDDGRYPNLAQVPPRPVNMPTFADAAALEKTLTGDQAKAKDVSPASPDAPSPQSAPEPVAARPVAPKPVAPAPAPAVAMRAEDASPCLAQAPVTGAPTVSLRFDPGSSALSADDLQLLTEALPTVRGSKGTLRILGHGDTDTGSAKAAGRFDLAAARAGAVAQALAGYGVPAPRIAVGVACDDAPATGASVQLYAEP